jgi:probable HAF family extracellular repeat protein
MFNSLPARSVRGLQVSQVQHLEPRRLFAAAYTLLEIGSSAVGVSDSGFVIGQVSHGAYSNAMYYDGTIHELPSPAGPGVSSQALSVNDVGQIVGSFDNADGTSTPFLLSNNVLSDLTSRGVATANAINDADLVTGTLGKPSRTLEGPAYFIGAGGGAFTRLRSIRPHSPSAGLAINASGRIVGWSDLPSRSGVETPHAFDFFTRTDFGPGSDNAVNNNGDSAGFIVTNSVTSATTAFMALSGSRVLLGTLGGTSSKAYGINDSDTVVGSSDVAGGGSTHAFIYSNGNMVDLNSLVDPSLDVTLTNAFAINASGQIVGTLRDANGVAHGYLLTPISTSNRAALTPTIMRNTLPTTITGKSVHGVVTLSITNSTATVEKGNAQIALYLASGASVDSSSISIGRISRPINLKPRAATSFVLSIMKLTESIPSGNYRLVAQTTDPLGKTATAVAPLVISISSPHVALGATIDAVSPAVGQRGVAASVTILLTNTGNIIAAGAADVDFGYTLDESTEAATFVKTTRPLHIGAGKSGKLVLSFVVPKTLTPGAYTPIVTITDSGLTTSAISAKPWTVS